MVTDVSLLELSRSLVEVSGAREYLSAAASAIQLFLPADDVVWMDTDFMTGRFEVWRASVQDRDHDAERLMPQLLLHPAIQSYVRNPRDLRPRRLADLRGHAETASAAALRLSQQHLGRSQLSLIVDVDPAGRGRGWIVTREGAEFSDSALASATHLAPLLLALDRVHHPHLDDDRSLGTGGSNRYEGWAELSTRERQVVDLLGAGLTARAIGNALGISARTVSKHLEHVYDKLGRHDRLLVALEAGAR